MKVFDTDLSGRTALVTGSTRGIGYASAVGLAAMGAVVAVNGRTAEAVDHAIAELGVRVPEGRFLAAPGDLATAEGCAAVIAAVPEVDVLVNNTGVYEPKPFAETPDEDWQRMFDVNVMSGVRLTRHHLPRMLERDWGRVVFVSSESAIVVPPEMIHYGFSKAAQLAIARGCCRTHQGQPGDRQLGAAGADLGRGAGRAGGGAGLGPGRLRRHLQGADLQRAPAVLAAAALRRAGGGGVADLLRLLAGGGRHQRRRPALRRRHRAHAVLADTGRSAGYTRASSSSTKAGTRTVAGP